MKIRILLFAAIVMMLAACEDMLDKQPLDKISGATFWLSPADAEAGIQACYDALQCRGTSKNMSYELWGLMDCFTPAAHPRDGGKFAIASGTHDPSNGDVASMWASAYKGIARCNDFLIHIDDISFAENESGRKERMKGEALFLRALFYYQLTMIYGDVPLILDVQEVSEAMVPRNPQAEVIQSIYDDLDVAVNSLPATYSGSDIARASKGAALTLKTKVQLLEEDFAGAAASAKAVIDSKVYSLQPNFPDVFNFRNENNSEVIFDIQFISFVNDGNCFEKMYSTRSHSSWGWTWIHPSLWLVEKFEKIEEEPEYTIEDDRIQPEVYDYFEGRDPRMDWTIIRPGAHTVINGNVDVLYPYGISGYTHSRTGMTVRKTIIEGEGGIAYDSPNNWILFRLADVLLMYAEAKTETLNGVIADASVYDAINEVRARASDKLPLYEVGSLTKEEMLENIRNESIRELALEGWLYPRFKRWDWLKLNDGFELMGMKTNGDICTFADSPILTCQYFDYYKWWPIPQQERDINTNLTQNSGYPE
ncbi:RagB/SusD family nutrient uptake outer membrane protein [Prolixibacteraceae bacterium Z1-6]|uniref:RagB/SusD family nutrient uptake outer membrane protein n=1 Tax=Draconibacterium aestuarii TaxID=2998507 RepID=A0A9X3J3H5_9BACT|nr:RagB/SusD family nutrient uptake outer membrane protein [Prolixibacteraceae bacterium Z1-6]